MLTVSLQSPLIWLRTLRYRNAAIKELRESGKFSEMSLQTDEDEHSIEMHLPFVRKIFEGYILARHAPYFGHC